MSNESPNIIFEELDSELVPDYELSEFVEAPLTMASYEDASTSYACQTSSQSVDQPDAKPQQKGNLIKRFIKGDLDYFDFNIQSEEEEEEEEEEYDEGSDGSNDNFPKKGRKWKKPRIKRTTKRHILPIALQGLMGQANLCFARNEVDMAEKLCLEIIRQAHMAPEPYLTLAQIYENRDMDKFIQFSLIAAYLQPNDEDQWIRLADLLIEQGNPKKAVTCYTRALKVNRSNVDIHLKRIEVLKSVGEEALAFRCCFRMITFIPPERGDLLMATAKMVAQKFHEDNKMVLALEAMSTAYERGADLFKTEDVNLFLELLIANNEYSRALEVITKHCGVMVQFGGEDSTEVETIDIPDTLILDFRAKLAVVLVHLKAFHLINMLSANVFSTINVEEAGDCYLDIAEALMKEKQYEHALVFLEPLVTSENFSLAAVWLRHADCNRAIGHIDVAINSYQNVVKLAQHVDARMTLSALLKFQGRMDEALAALQQDADMELLDAGLLHERCIMLKEMGRLDEYLEEGYKLILRHCTKLRNRTEIQAVATLQRHGHRIQTLRETRETRCEPVEDDVPEFSKTGNEIALDTEWSFFMDLCQTAYDLGHYGMMAKLLFTAQSSKRFHASYAKDLEFLCLLACIYNRDPYLGYNMIRECLRNDLRNHKLWNLFNVVILITDDARYNRYLMRTSQRDEVPTMVRLMKANYCLSSGTFKYAINEYLQFYKENKDPLVSLLIAVTFIQIASQKYTDKKHSLLTQAIAFMEEYKRMREPEAAQEVLYNMGRLYHQMGVTNLAEHYYKQALECHNEMVEQHKSHLDLSAELAFSLHLIYRQSGNMNLARKYLYDYIQV